MGSGCNTLFADMVANCVRSLIGVLGKNWLSRSTAMCIRLKGFEELEVLDEYQSAGIIERDRGTNCRLTNVRSLQGIGNLRVHT